MLHFVVDTITIKKIHSSLTESMHLDTQKEITGRLRQTNEPYFKNTFKKIYTLFSIVFKIVTFFKLLNHTLHKYNKRNVNYLILTELTVMQFVYKVVSQ